MAATGSNKGNDNFEKMKKEMADKRDKAAGASVKKTAAKTEGASAAAKPVRRSAPANKKTDKPTKAPAASTPKGPSTVIEVPDEAKTGHMRQEANVHDENPVTAIIEPHASEEDSGAPEKADKIAAVAFRIGNEEFALKISQVKEIIRIPKLTRLPKMPHYLSGICSLRDELLPVIDSRVLFNISATDLGESDRVIVVDLHERKTGLIVDKVSEVLNIDEGMIIEPPGTLRGIDGGIINGITLLDGGKRVIMFLDAEKVINLSDTEGNDARQDETVNDTEKSAGEEEQLVVFEVGSETYAMSIACVKEIIRRPDIFKVPNTPGFVEGVFSIRNQLMAAVSLARLLSIGQERIDEKSRAIIVDNGSYSFGVVVDRVTQVIRVQKASLRYSSQSTGTAKQDYLKGFLELENGKKLLAVLDPLKLITEDEVAGVMTAGGRLTEVGERENQTNDSGRDVHVVIFRLDGNEFGIKIEYVKEINRISEIVHLPGSPPFIDGLVNLRSEAISVMNLSKFFERDSSNGISEKFLVAEYREKKIGILIDSASEVRRIPHNLLEEVSELLENSENDKYIEAIMKLNDGKRVVLLLNLPTILSFL